jgi:hypothetical protein
MKHEFNIPDDDPDGIGPTTVVKVRLNATMVIKDSRFVPDGEVGAETIKLEVPLNCYVDSAEEAFSAAADEVSNALAEVINQEYLTKPYLKK